MPAQYHYRHDGGQFARRESLGVYFKDFIWDDTMAQDRFYGYADPALYNQVKLAQTQGTFERVPGFAVFHKEATAG